MSNCNCKGSSILANWVSKSKRVSTQKTDTNSNSNSQKVSSILASRARIVVRGKK